MIAARTSLAVIVLASLVACSKSGSSGALPESHGPDGGGDTRVLTVQPDPATLDLGGTVALSAWVDGVQTLAHWSVDEGLTYGSIDPSGLFSAIRVGSFHVTATTRNAPPVTGHGAVVVRDPSAAPIPLCVNIDGASDWGRQQPFADAMKEARRFGVPGNGTGEGAPVDADGWPTGTGADVIVMADMPLIHGRYRLGLDGDRRPSTGASVSASDGGTFTGWAYDAGTNRTTATMDLPAGATTLVLSFRGFPAGGIRNVKLMRPIAVGSTTSHAETELFSRNFLARASQFTTWRTLGWSEVNDNPTVNWAERTLPSYATMQRGTPGFKYGAAWEYLVLLANGLHKDIWINIPHKASEAYVTKLAQLFRYGSDGVEPYTSVQGSPIYPPLDPALNIYIEWSNEVWNTSFSQWTDNLNAARAEVSGGDPWHYQYDGTTDDLDWARRRTSRMVIWAGTIFREVFGITGPLLQSRIRPIFTSQHASEWETIQRLRYADDVFGPESTYPVDRWIKRQPVAHYAWGVSGSSYYYLSGDGYDSGAMGAEAILNAYDMATLHDRVRISAAWAGHFGLKAAVYEGGSHLVNGANAVAAQYLGAGGPYGDAGASDPVKTGNKGVMRHMYRDWFQVGGDLHCYVGLTGRANGGQFWYLSEWTDKEDETDGLTPWTQRNTTTAPYAGGGTPKWAAVKGIKSEPRIQPLVGTAVPATLFPADAITGSGGYMSLPSGGHVSGDTWVFDGGRASDVAYFLRVSSPRTFTVSTTLSGAGGALRVEVDGVTVATWSGTGTKSVTTASLGAGLHTLRVKAASATGATLGPVSVL